MKAQPELWTVAERLGDLRDEVVFIGGMVRSLLVTDPAAGPARPTNDVDCIIDVTAAGRVVLHERLRALGFRVSVAIRNRRNLTGLGFPDGEDVAA